MNTLQDISLLVTDGKHGDCQDEEGSGFYFVSCKDVRDGWIDYSGARQITEADYLDTHRRTQLEINDIVITNSGTIGRMALVPNAPETNRTTFQKSVAIVKPNQEKVVPQWLYYSLMANRDVLIGWSGGTAQKNLLLRDMRAFNVDVPPLPTQRKIAAILSAYDDLIENNLRRIKVLEEIAQNLYREWFVKYRFPGHQHARFIDSPLGPIPEGWEVQGAMENKNWSFIHQSIGPYEGVKRYYATADIDGITITGDGIEYTYSQKPSRAQKQPLLNSVWFARMQETYKVLAVTKPNAILTTNSTLSSGFAGFEAPDGDSFAFLFLTIKSKEFHSEKDRYCTGATQRSLTNDGLSRILTISPPREIVQHFGRVAMSFVELILALQQRSQTLHRTRDLLLPRLISGEVDVSELDIAVPEEALT